MLSCLKSSKNCKLKILGFITQSGTWSNSLTKTFNVKNVYSYYNKLSIDDFALSDDIYMMSFRVNMSSYAINGLTKSYDSNNGILTVTFKHPTNTSEYQYGYNFKYPIIILDRYGVGG